ncbi:hypothetical protein DPMN_002467 [Dreissena polymorpha]|uniref:Uncharacterized protein n=1 Tax=Dreissena polymorpha TaxID=45954 RepID=A0A9D4MJR4_DREPO|nr:hypothetical protein DPMN_002467 [Dreissena polymorpha]
MYVASIHSHCNLTRCDQTYGLWISIHIPVTHHLVLLAQKLDSLIIVVCNQDLSIWESTYA